MSKEQKTLKSCYILDRLREWFELYGNQNHQRAEEELHLAIDELYEYQQKDRQIADLEAKLAEKEEELKYYETLLKRQCSECKDQDKISFAIEQLEKVKDDLLDISSPYWQYFAKSGDAFMTYEDVEQWTKEFIDNQIKQLKEKNNGTKICQN